MNSKKADESKADKSDEKMKTDETKEKSDKEEPEKKEISQEEKDQMAADKLKESPYLWITGLNSDAKANAIRSKFQEAEISGTIKNIKVAVSKKQGTNTAFAFVEMDSSEAALQIIETFHEKELLDKVVQIKQVDSDPTIPKKKAPAENGQKRSNSGQATLVPKRPRLEKKTEGDTKVVVTFNDDKVEAQMDVAVVKKLKSEISAVKKDITKNVREDKKLQSDLRREKEKLRRVKDDVYRGFDDLHRIKSDIRREEDANRRVKDDILAARRK